MLSTKILNKLQIFGCACIYALIPRWNRSVRNLHKMKTRTSSKRKSVNEQQQVEDQSSPHNDEEDDVGGNLRQESNNKVGENSFTFRGQNLKGRAPRRQPPSAGRYQARLVKES